MHSTRVRSLQSIKLLPKKIGFRTGFTKALPSTSATILFKSEHFLGHRGEGPSRAQEQPICRARETRRESHLLRDLAHFEALRYGANHVFYEVWPLHSSETHREPCILRGLAHFEAMKYGANHVFYEVWPGSKQ